MYPIGAHESRAICSLNCMVPSFWFGEGDPRQPVVLVAMVVHCSWFRGNAVCLHPFCNPGAPGTLSRDSAEEPGFGSTGAV